MRFLADPVCASQPAKVESAHGSPQRKFFGMGSMDGMADRMAVITGAAIGLGRTRAPACARHGVRAPLVDVDEDGLAATVALAPRCHVTKNPERHGRRAPRSGRGPRDRARLCGSGQFLHRPAPGLRDGVARRPNAIVGGREPAIGRLPDS